MTILWRSDSAKGYEHMTRDKGILIKVTQDELLAVKEAAKKAGKSVSEFARVAMLGAPTTVEPTKESEQVS